MKNKTIYIILGILIIGGLIWALSASKRDLGGEASRAQVSVLEKTLWLGASKETAVEVEDDKTEAETGSYLKTGEKGRALIELGNAKSLMDYNSEIVLTAKTEEGGIISLLTGATWSRVEKLFDKGEYHEIKTKNTVASVRGTSFGMDYDSLQNLSELFVATGTVAFSALDLNGNIIATSTVYVEGGEKARRMADGRISVTALTEEDMKEEWYLYNEPSFEGEEKPEIKTEVKVETKSEVNVPIVNNPPVATPPASTPPIDNYSGDTNYDFRVNSVEPRTVVKGSGETLKMMGEGFKHAIALDLNNRRINFTLISDSQINFVLPADIATEIYDITLWGEGRKTAELKSAFDVAPAPNSF